MTFDQAEFDIRCEWGEQGIAHLAPISDAVIIVDVMSFSTCVTIATARGATVFPFRWKDESSIDFAQSMNAELAGPRGKTKYSLSPASLRSIPSGTRLVLPSPNGSTLTFSTGETPTFIGCLRNAKEVAQAAARLGARIAVIPAGERWQEDQSLRPALEDLLGAGAIIHHLEGCCSPEARMAAHAYQTAEPRLFDLLRQSSSGKELISRGFEEDVVLASEVDADDCVPFFRDGTYVKQEIVR